MRAHGRQAIRGTAGSALLPGLARPLALIAALVFTGAIVPTAPTSGALAGPTRGAPAGPRAVRPGPLWDDGLAEVSRYEATRVVYGRERTFEAIFIVVKEPFLADSLVKAESPAAGVEIFEVLKLNQILEIPTPNYDYHQLGSIFVRREDPLRLVKETAGSQEWCGNTFHEILAAAKHPVYRHRSYFEGEADGETSLDLREGDLFEDALPLSLRFLDLEEGASVDVRIWPSRLSNRAGPFQPAEATIEAKGRERIEAAGCTHEVRRLDVASASLSSSFFVAQDDARTLVRFTASDGRSLHLRSVERRDYWTRRE